MRYETILFDADGTLLDFGRAEDEALRESLASMGIIADDEMVKTYSGINDALWKALERGEVTKEVLRHRRFERFFAHYGFDLDAHVMASKLHNGLVAYEAENENISVVGRTVLPPLARLTCSGGIYA